MTRLTWAMMMLVGMMSAIGSQAQGATPSDASTLVGNCVSTAASIPRPLSGGALRRIEQQVERAIATHEIPGGVFVVVHQGCVVARREFGSAHLASRRPMSTSNTVLAQGSITKLLVWILAMQLAEDGRLELDRDINDYLDFDVEGKGGETITMRHLMTHSAGFSQRLHMVQPGFEHADRRAQLLASLPERVYRPGEVVAYSNYGAALAAHVVERLRGESFEALATKQILRPLGMHDSTVVQPTPSSIASRLAWGYGASDRVGRTPSPVGLAPAGSLVASADDMGRFAQWLTAGRSDTRVLGHATRAQMMALQRPLLTGMRDGLGLGFIVGEYRGTTYAGHGGSLPGGATDLQVLPEQSLAWYVGFNGRGTNGAALPWRKELVRKIIDELPSASNVPLPRQAGSLIAADLEGEYVPARRAHIGFPTLISLGTVGVEAQPHGVARVHVDGTAIPFVPVAPDEMRQLETGAQLRVERNQKGEVVRFASTAVDTVTVFERAPAYLPVARIVLLTAPAVLFGLLLLAAAGAIHRRFRHTAHVPRRARRRTESLLVGICALGAAAWIGLLAAAVTGSRVPASLGLAYAVFPSLAILGIAAAAELIGCATLAWRDRGRSMGSRLYVTVAACASICLAWMYAVFGMTRYSIQL